MNTRIEFDYQVLNLTNKFYSDYPNPPYTEILKKGTRPYNCLLIQSKYGYFICIPYRDDYVSYVTKFRKHDKVNFERHYKYSTLKYFHKELGIA